MALAKILQMLLRSPGGKKAAAKLYKQSTKSIPTKSPGTPGVKVGSKPTLKDLDYFKRTGTFNKPQMVRGEYPKPPRDAYGSLVGNKGLGYQSDSPFGSNPLKRQIAMRLSKRDPGMARGLQKMESRKASAMNTPGTPFEGRALRYEPSIARAANFNSLIVKDRGFREFLANTVGNKKVMDISPSMKDKLAKRYLSLKRKNIDAAEAYSREMDIMEGPDERFFRMIRGLGDLD
tara:strand:+ start:6221 stop:6919 length:699 start_codon:yes stop_codon:yes gene_type:complete